MTSTHRIHGNSRLLIDHARCSYVLQHPYGGSHNNWADIITANSPEDFLNSYLTRNIRRISAQPERVAENVRTVLGALCACPTVSH